MGNDAEERLTALERERAEIDARWTEIEKDLTRATREGVPITFAQSFADGIEGLDVGRMRSSAGTREHLIIGNQAFIRA